MNNIPHCICLNSIILDNKLLNYLNTVLNWLYAKFGPNWWNKSHAPLCGVSNWYDQYKESLVTENILWYMNSLWNYSIEIKRELKIQQFGVIYIYNVYVRITLFKTSLNFTIYCCELLKLLDIIDIVYKF